MNIRTVDIIIPTYRPGGKFERLITELLRQSWNIEHIYVIHTKGGKFPHEVKQLDKRVIVKEIEPTAFDHGGTRKMAAGFCESEIFICMTQDAIPADTHLVENLVHAFDDKEVACAYARQLPDKDCGIIERYTRSFNYPEESCIKDIHSVKELGIKTFFCSNVCAAYRRESYEEQGGFVERAIFNEDMIMTGKLLKAGYKCAYVSSAKIFHSHNYTCGQQFKRNFDVAVSQVDNPDIFGGIKSEGEGIRLVKKTASYLIHNRKPWLVLPLFVKSGFKLLGFRLGRCYKYLPKWLLGQLSSNPRYWKAYKGKRQI